LSSDHTAGNLSSTQRRGIFYAPRHKTCYTPLLHDIVVFVLPYSLYLPENYTCDGRGGSEFLCLLIPLA
jgi:hypothetical protein